MYEQIGHERAGTRHRHIQVVPHRPPPPLVLVPVVVVGTVPHNNLLILPRLAPMQVTHACLFWLSWI